MTVFITGGAGYLGTVLVRQLLHAGVEVVVFDRFSWGVQPLAAVMRPGLAVVRGDIRDLGALAAAIRRTDAVIHLAAVVGYPACDADPQDADTTNVDGTAHVVKAADGRPVYFASTGSCYGQVDGIATEDTPLSPLTRYGRTKAIGERLVLGADGCVLRLATLHGLSPRMRWDLLPHDFARRGVAGAITVYDGAARRTFLHVEEAAAAVRFALSRELHGIYNVGNDHGNLTKRQVAEHVRLVTGCTITDVAGADPDGRDYGVHFGRLRAAGWLTTRPFDLRLIIDLARVWQD